MSVLKALLKRLSLPLHLFEISVNSAQVYFLGFCSVLLMFICFLNTAMSWLLYLYTKTWSGLVSSDIVIVIEYCWLFWDSPLHINLYFFKILVCVGSLLLHGFSLLVVSRGRCLFWCLGFLLGWLLWSTYFSCCGLCSCGSDSGA